jgi:hypothetical protein
MSWLSDLTGTSSDQQWQQQMDLNKQEGEARKNFATEAIPLLPQAPSFTDIVGQLFQQKKARTGAIMGGSRGSTFLTGPLGDQSYAPIGTKTLLGG